MPRQLMIAAAFLCFSVPAMAGQILEYAKTAEAALAAKDYDTAASALRMAQDIVWDEMPLKASNVTIVDAAAGLGVYKPRGNSTFKKSEEMTVYAEVEGYAFGDDGLGNNQLALDVSVTLKSPQGEELGSESQLGTIRLNTRSHNREMFAKIDLKLDTLPVGKYVGAFTMTDANSKKSTKFDAAFEVTD